MLDVAVAVAAGAANCEALWEQDIWWQVRLGEEVMAGHFPSTEEWSYTAVGRPFHNHWWLASVILSAIYHLGGVFGLTLSRGGMAAVIVWLLCQLRPKSSLRWPIAALGFAITQHRIQVRPESLCFALFVLLFLLARRLGERRAADASLSRVWWPREVLAMYACVALSANLHFGVVPWVLFGALMLLADGVFDAAPTSLKVPLLGLMVDMACVCRALPAVVAVCLSPQPLPGVHYILHHAPGNMNVHEDSKNPEHQPLMKDLGDAFSNQGSSSSTGGRWLALYLVLSVIAPIIWAFTPAKRRPHGLRHPLIVLGGHGVLLALSFDRSRNLVYSAYLALAMLGASSDGGTAGKEESKKQSKHRRSATAKTQDSSVATVVRTCIALLVSAALIFLTSHAPELGVMSTHNWPVRSTAFVNEARPKGNVFHGPTSGGWLAYWLHRDYPVMTDTRQYCFAHFDEEYQKTQNDNRWLLEWNLKYNVSTMILKIPMYHQIDADWVISPADPLVNDLGWARVFFDHFSEVMVKRMPEHHDLISKHEIKILDPAKPPDFYARLIYGKKANEAFEQRLRAEVKSCMARPHPEWYCQLVEICLNVGGGAQASTMSKALETLDGIPCSLLARTERNLVRSYTESLKVHLRKQLGLPVAVNRCGVTQS